MRGRLIVLALALAAPAAAQSPVSPGGPPKPGASTQPASDPAFEAARSLFEALPEAERRAMQDALVWTGDFNGVVTGTFGRRTFEALNAARARLKGADPLDPAQRPVLLGAAEAARRAAGFALRTDPATGLSLGVPERLLPKRSAIPGGTRWQSADGGITLDARAHPPGETDLDALFERATAPLNDRKVTYKLKRPDFIVVTAETGAGKSYQRYAAGTGGIRGFAFGYGKGRASEIDRIVIAVANNFTPFPEAPAVGPAATASPAPPRPSSAAGRPAAPAGTGLGVARDHVLTAAAALDGCTAPRVAGSPARLLRSDPVRGLALLEAPGIASGRRPLRTTPPAPGEDLVVLSMDAGEVAAAPGSAVAEPARTSQQGSSENAPKDGWEGAVLAPLQPGAAGAAVLDRAGNLAGLVARDANKSVLVAGIMPPVRRPLVSGAALAAFLREAGIETAPPIEGAPGLGSAVSPYVGSVVAVTCGG